MGDEALRERERASTRLYRWRWNRKWMMRDSFRPCSKFDKDTDFHHVRMIKISSVTALLMSTAGGEVASIDAWRCHFFLHVHPFMVMVHLYPTIIYVVYSIIFSMDMWICPSRFIRSDRESGRESAQDSRQMGL